MLGRGPGRQDSGPNLFFLCLQAEPTGAGVERLLRCWWGLLHPQTSPPVLSGDWRWNWGPCTESPLTWIASGPEADWPWSLPLCWPGVGCAASPAQVGVSGVCGRGVHT